MALNMTSLFGYMYICKKKMYYLNMEENILTYLLYFMYIWYVHYLVGEIDLGQAVQD